MLRLLLLVVVVMVVVVVCVVVVLFCFSAKVFFFWFELNIDQWKFIQKRESQVSSTEKKDYYQSPNISIYCIGMFIQLTY
jgi:flagellar basal body-associated protein FliL